MANKYIRHGETYCGDGTTSAAATSNGGVGAWNNINVFEGTAPAYGALAAGDVVYIRSKDQAGADITRTLTANWSIGAAVATTANWVTWIVDGGTVWSGISGTVTYSCPSSYSVTHRAYNDIRADLKDRFVISTPAQSTNVSRVIYNTNCRNENILIDLSLNTNISGDGISVVGPAEVTCKNIHIKLAHYYPIGFSCGGTVKANFLNPEIELCLELNGNDLNAAVFSFLNYGTRLNIIGGRVFGPGATTGATLITGLTLGGGATLVGMQVPKSMMLSKNNGAHGIARVEATGLDGGMGGAMYDVWGMADSRSDGYYPTLNAFFPDSVNTPWSWKVYANMTGVTNPFSLTTSKVFTDSPASKTITAYLLVADSLTAANAGNVWVEVIYVDDTTGAPVILSSRDIAAGALAGDTATWTLTYGLDTTKVSIPLVGLFSKKHISVTTPTAIKQDTPVLINLFGTVKAVSALDLIFYCPDASIA